MSLKIAISGKGGVGKSTLAAMLAHAAAAEGQRVLAIDADPDANLAAALGMPMEQRARIVPLSTHKALIEERTGAKVKQYGQMFRLNPNVSDIAERESAHFRGIHLLVLGAVEAGGSGCACPESVLLRALLMDAVLHKDETLVVDMEAGLEHLGRGTARGVDLMIVVVEPGSRAVETAKTIKRLAGEIGLTRLAIVANKVSSAGDLEFLRDTLGEWDWLGEIPTHEAVRQSDRDGVVLFDSAPPELLNRFHTIRDRTRVYEQTASTAAAAELPGAPMPDPKEQ